MLIRLPHKFFAPDGEGGVASPAPAAAPAAAPAPTPSPAPAPASSSPAASPDSAGGAAPAPASPAAAQTARDLVPAELEALFGFDPFQPKAPAKEPPAPGAAPPAAQPGATPPAAQGQPPAVPAAAPPTSGPSVDDLRQELARLQGQIEQANRPAAPAADPSKDPPDVEVPGYQFSVPEPLVAALASENAAERQQALGALIQGSSQVVHREVVRAMRKELSAVLPTMFSRMIENHQAQKAIHDEFYGDYKHLNNPTLKPLVQNVANMMTQEGKHNGWTPEFRKELGERVTQMLQAATPQAASPQAPPPPPPVLNSSGARPAPAPLPGQQQDMQDLLVF